MNFGNLRGSSRRFLPIVNPYRAIWLTIDFIPAKKPKTENNNKSIQGHAKKNKSSLQLVPIWTAHTGNTAAITRNFSQNTHLANSLHNLLLYNIKYIDVF